MSVFSSMRIFPGLPRSRFVLLTVLLVSCLHNPLMGQSRRSSESLSRSGTGRSASNRAGLISPAARPPARGRIVEPAAYQLIDPVEPRMTQPPPAEPREETPRRPRLRPDAVEAARADQDDSKYVLQRVAPDRTLELEVGRPILLNFRNAPFRSQIADPTIADFINITESEFSITGYEVGITVLNFWFRDPDDPERQEILSYLVRVMPDPEEGRRFEALLAGLEFEVNRAFPNSVVKLTYVGSQVVVRGQAKDIEEATHILRVVGQSIPGSDATEKPFDPTEFFVGGIDAASLEESGGLTGLLRGDPASGVNPRQINRRIINMLQIAGVHQIMLKVTVAEVNRSAARAIGADLAIGEGNSTSFFSLLPLAQLGVPVTGGNLLVNRGDFDLAINALKSLNLARSLAEPNLVTLNGQPASFQVGGQFPVPQITGFTSAGLQGVEFVPFGVQLNFLPIVTDHNRIRLQLMATVSTRDESLGTNIGGSGEGGGSNVAGLNSRNFQTTVELRHGQTLAIAGLIQNNFGGQSRRVPFLGDIPYVGRLFSSDGDSYDEQELVVIVTPYLVSPLEEGDLPPLPGTDMFEPDDFEFYLRGSLVGARAEDYRSPARTDIHKMHAFRQLEQKYIIGQPGHSDGGRFLSESLHRSDPEILPAGSRTVLDEEP